MNDILIPLGWLIDDYLAHNEAKKELEISTSY